VILSEGSNQIRFQYLDVDFTNDTYDNGGSATVGVQLDSTFAAEYSCNTPSLAAGKAILFTPPPFMVILSPSEAGVCDGKPRSLTGTLWNGSGSTQTYALSGRIETGTGSIFLPSTLTVPANGTGNFTVTVRSASDSVLASVTASQGGQQVVREVEVSVEPGLWVAETASPAGAWAPAVAAHGNYLYQIGGYDSDWNQTAAVYRYDTATKTWAARADLPTEVTYTNAATIGNKIYVPGGYNGSVGYLNTLYIYDTASNSWSTGATLPVNLGYAPVVTDGQKLYVVSGYDGTSGQNSDKIYIYDPALDSWATGADMPAGTGGYYASGACIGGKIYVAGGVVGPSGVDTLATRVYTIASNTWGTAPDLPDPGLASYDGGWSAFNGGVIDDRYFVVFGGDNESWECSRKAVVFDTQKGKWEDAGDLNSCLIGSKGAAVGKVFYRIGGEKDYMPFDMSTEYYSQCQGFPWSMFLPVIEHGAKP
jgi:N-acetylneuraminic acid mutarotase